MARQNRRIVDRFARLEVGGLQRDPERIFSHRMPGAGDETLLQNSATLGLTAERHYADVVEVPWPKQRIVGYGVGPKKMSERFCYIGAHSDHVNLGFYYGAQLPDPEGLLEGTGKKLRHIKVRDVEEVDGPAIRHMLQLSLEERKESLGLEK